MSNSEKSVNIQRELKAYWFIPDGLRADNDEFNIFKWAEEGHLPNIRKLMMSGSYGLSKPFFPSHTPTNFATLLTGSSPEKHRVTDGPIRLKGFPLKYVTKPGFRSSSKKIESIWHIFQKEELFTTLISVPGSTPPDFDFGQVVRGRWGGWGFDLPAVVITNHKKNKESIKDERLFFEGISLTKTVPVDEKDGVSRFSFNRWDHQIDFKIQRVNGSEVLSFKINEKEIKLKELEWSEWEEIEIKKPLKNIDFRNQGKVSKLESDLSKVTLKTKIKLVPIQISANGDFRIRVLYDLLNHYVVRPFELADRMKEVLPELVDFCDNYPPQLIRHENDKLIFLDEMRMSFDWHNKMAKFILDRNDSNLIIQNIYSPNQMLTSRWWMDHLDRRSEAYSSISLEKKQKAKEEVLSMYKKIDDLIGVILNKKDEDALVIFSSDHGAAPLDYKVNLNNLFFKKGWLNLDEKGEIDWEKTKVVFLKTANIYINPKGLGGNLYRSSGKEYHDLREKVIEELTNLRHLGIKSPISSIVKFEESKRLFQFKEQVGDLIVSNKVGYGFSEHVSKDKKIFLKSVRTGYKQALLPDTYGLTTPFIIAGPGIKKGHRIKEKIDHTRQLGTILKALKIKIPESVSGLPVEEVFR